MRPLLLALLIGVGAGACRKTHDSARPRAAALSPVALDLVVSQSPADELRVVVTIRNPSARAIWMNGRLAVNDRRSLPVAREVWFELTEEDGTDVGTHCVIDNPAAHAEDYVVVKPAASLRASYSLDCFDLSAGKYRIVAFYGDGNPHPPPAPAGSVGLRQQLVSPPRTFEIAPWRSEPSPP
jgi:hypothetical protein